VFLVDTLSMKTVCDLGYSDVLIYILGDKTWLVVEAVNWTADCSCVAVCLCVQQLHWDTRNTNLHCN
jgi:hypothetical protein